MYEAFVQIVRPYDDECQIMSLSQTVWSDTSSGRVVRRPVCSDWLHCKKSVFNVFKVFKALFKILLKIFELDFIFKVSDVYFWYH